MSGRGFFIHQPKFTKAMRNLFAFAVVALVCAACTNPAALSEDDEVSVEKQRVTFKFSPYTVTSMGAKANHAPKATRATVPVSSVVNHLDVWLMEGDSTTALAKHESVAESHQTVADDGFGSLSLTLDKSKTYTLYAVGHKESAPTTLSTGVVSFPDTKKSQTLYYSSTFTPAKTTKLNCKMLRAVGMFRIIIEDEIPSEVKKMEITAGETPTQWRASLSMPASPRRTPIPYRGRASSTRMTAPRCSAFISWAATRKSIIPSRSLPMVLTIPY